MRRRRSLAFGLGLAALAALLPAGAPATTLRSLSVGELLARSELVFEGRALSRESHELAPGGAIRTCVRFEVLEVVKGPRVASPLELCFAGGTVGARTRGVEGLSVPAPGEHGIYFVADLAAPRVNPLAGWDQGRFRIRAGDVPDVTTADGRPVVALDADAPPADREGAPRAPRGARAEASAARGLSPDAFKARLRELTGAPAR